MISLRNKIECPWFLVYKYERLLLEIFYVFSNLTKKNQSLQKSLSLHTKFFFEISKTEKLNKSKFYYDLIYFILLHI